MRHQLSARYGNVLLRPLAEKDIEQLRLWRNEPANTKYIRPIGHITPEQQRAWFYAYLEDPDMVTFAIEELEQYGLVGSVSLYNFRGKTMEFGKIMVGDNRVRGTGLGRIAVILDLYIGFSLLGAETIDAVVHEDNIAALTADQKAGFTIVGQHPYPLGGQERELLAKRAAFFAKHDFLDEIVIENPCESF